MLLRRSGLAELRKQNELLRPWLSEPVGVSQRVIAYYESVVTQPPGAVLADVARALKVPADEVLGLKQK